MTPILADIRLKQWAAWLLTDGDELGIKPAKWQTEYSSGYAEEPDRITPGDDCAMEMVERAVIRLNGRSPQLAAVIEVSYIRRRQVEPDMLDGALLGFCQVWGELQPLF